MEIKGEACTLCEGGIDIEVAIHFLGHLLTDGQTETVTRREVTNLQEGFEHIIPFLYWYTFTGVRDKELVSMGPRFLNSRLMVPLAGVYSAALVSKWSRI